ncbi:fatty-acyl-CoA synthase [Marivirga sericea]|uniref:Fatty-acyl-CoA synthase n=1 Tax=Marivirga sericea TaxID=1028 RepID=A0A1X7L511_9BACT|nr:AMP-binding protein [Marivirga sericea]SMG48473.1 fatty-acyl-CoA synthase [Marivirga sericea]
MKCDWFEKWSTYSPTKLAVKNIGTGQGYDYKSLNHGANAVATILEKDFNLTKGDRLLILGDFDAEYVALLGVAQKMGIILVPLNYRLSANEIAFLVQNSDPSLIIVAEEYRSLLKEVPQLVADKVISFTQYSDWLLSAAKAQKAQYNSKPLEENHPAFILYTSGTTGQPKGAIYTHGMMLWNSINTSIRLKITSDDIYLNVMPPFHTGGWNVLTAPILHFGGTLIMMPKFDSEHVLKALEREKVSISMLVPTMVRMLSECDDFRKIDFSQLRYMIVGGEALPIQLIEQWNEQGVPIRQGYGLTECGPNITSLEAEDAIRKRGSIGFPNFYVDTKLVNEEGVKAGQQEKGELWIKGPIVTTGYWKNAKETEKAIVDGWFKTGDILIEDEDGYLYVVDRIKNMYISGGENVYPAEVEKCILKHPEIKEVCVVGVAHDKWGEVGKAFLVFKNGQREVSDLTAYCIKNLAKYKVPKYFEVMKELPKNDTGKIDRKMLR